MAARQAARSAADTAQGTGPGGTESVNEILLRGRLAAEPDERVLPSGDAVVTFRLVVDRPSRSGGSRVAATGARVDTLDCAVFKADLRRRVKAWRAGDVLEVRGGLRRRFFRTGAGPASRYEVEVGSAARVARAPA